MATTTNFGWETPDDTDLVKDGALAMRTLGNAIDTSLVDLKGGTTGQVLSKTSNTDMDFTWVTSDDANAIQNAIVDAKGDLITATAADTPARLAVGSNGDTLVADSAASTGLRYTAGVGLTQPVINGGFDIWQRGTSIAQTAGANYTADRWQQGGDSPSAVTVTRQATGDTTNLPFVQYCARVQRNSGSSDTTTVGICTSIESANTIPYSGKVVTVSFYARKGSNFSAASDVLRMRLLTSTVTDQNILINGGTSVIDQNATLTSTWQRFSYSGTVGATAVSMGILFTYDPVGTASANDYYELTGVQIDVGNVALPFRRAGGTIQGELAACMRYFQRAIVAGNTNERLSTGQAISTTAAEITHRFPVIMRGNPTLSVSSASHYFLISSSGGAAGAPTSITGGILTPNMARVDCTGSSSLTAGNATSLQSSSASSTLDFSAEL